jgi:hypothetical protein
MIKKTASFATSVARVLCAVVLSSLAGCGGGGGDTTPPTSRPPPPPPPAQVFAPSPAELAATFTTGAPPTLTVTLTPTPVFTATVFASISPASLMQAPTVTLNPGGTYTVSLQPLNALAPGQLTGTLTIKLCYDSACATPAPGSPVTLPYWLTIVPPPPPLTLTPATISGNFVAGTPFPFSITVQAVPAPGLSAPLYVGVNDRSGTISSAASFGYLVPTDSHQLLQVQAVSTLGAGTHSGTFALNVCSDSGCQHPVPGSPMSVPFSIMIAAAPANSGLTTLVPWPGVTGWATYQGNNSHTGFVPVTLDPGVFAYRWMWTTPSTASNAKQLSTLTATAGQLYVNSGSVLYALKEYDHATVWSHDFSNIVVYASAIVAALNPAAVSGGNVYITTSAQNATYMFGLAASNGTVLFQSPFLAQWEHYLAPTIGNGIAYTDGGEYGGMYAFDATAGAQDFYANLAQYDEWTPAVDAHYAYAYVGGSLSWVNNTSGAAVGTVTDPTWQWSGYSMHGAPILGAANSVIAVNVGNLYQNSLIDFNTSTNTVSWTNAGPYGGNPAYANGVIYATNKTPMRLEARSEATGALQWSWAPPTPSETSYIGDVLITNNIVLLSTNTTTYAVDATTHATVWSMPAPGWLALSESGVLYVVTADSNGLADGRIIAINVK